MEQRITILVNSCDKYEDAWHPFFECLWHFAGDLPYPIILNTETKQFSSPHYDVQVVNSKKNCTWSERLLNVLEYVETEYVFFLLDDYFLKDRFDIERFDSVIDYMRCHPDVGIVDVRPRWAGSAEEEALNRERYKNIEDSFVERNEENFNITCSPAIWRTDVLKSLLRPHEDVWSFEYYSGIRAKKYGIKVVRFFTRVPTIYEYDYQVWTGMGITAGQWLPKNKAFFDSLGIEVNYDRLGILDASSLEEIRVHNRLNMKTMVRKAVQKLKKRMNRRKSLK